MNKFVKLIYLQHIVKYTGNSLIFLGLWIIHMDYRSYRNQMENNIKFAKKELVENLQIFTEEEFEENAQKSRALANKEYFTTLFSPFTDFFKKLNIILDIFLIYTCIFY